MSEAEQLAAIEILDTRCAEAVLFASVYQAYDIARDLEDADVVRVRDQWRVILMHDLGGVGAASARDAATVSGSGSDPLVDLDSSRAQLLFSELARLRPEEDYFRVSHAESGAVAYADYKLDVGLWYDLETDDYVEFEPPDASLHAWDAAVERLLALAA